MQRILNTLFQAGLKLALVVAFMLCNSLFLRAQTYTYRVNYRFDNATLDRNYMQNAQTFASMDSMIAANSGILSEIEIVSYSSPEGNYSYNRNLSVRRAVAMQRYLTATYPELEDKVSVNPGVEAWDMLRENVVADTRLSENARRSILEIIDGNAAPDAKESALKALPEYKSLYSRYFRSLRYAEFVLRIENSAISAADNADSAISEGQDTTATATSGEGQATTGTATGATETSGTRTSGANVPGIQYATGEDFIRPDYMDNAAAMREIRRFFSSNNVRRLTIVGVATPDGPASLNESLALRRAQNLADYIIGMFPEMEGRINVVSAGENWSGLRSAILESDSFTDAEKDELLAIIDSNETPDRKEALLKAHPAYRRIESDIYPVIRSSSFGSIEIEGAEEEAPVQPADTTATIPADTTATQPADSTHAGLPGVAGGSTYVPVVTSRPREYTTIAAVKTNLLYDAVTALNVEVEVPIADRFSVMVEDVFPWWETGNKYCFQYWEMGIEPRYWFNSWDSRGSEKLRGFFAGPYLMSAKYDFQNDKEFNYQGEHWSAGISAGWCTAIGSRKRVNLELSFALGFLSTRYRNYLPMDDYSKLIRNPYKNGSAEYFGPTKAKVSLVVPINIPRRGEEVYHD